MKIVKNCARCFFDELKLKNFGLHHHMVDQFYRSQCQTGERSVLYLIYRWIWALFFVGVFIACVSLQFSGGKMFIFLTNWGILLCLVTNLLAAILVTLWHFNIGGTRDHDAVKVGVKMPCAVKCYWLLHSVSLSLAVVITTIYWIFLHGKMDKPMRYPVMSLITHCLNSVFMLVDFLIVAFPVRILHTIYAMLLPTFYCLFTVVYFFCGGVDEYGRPYVYPILDWTKPARGITTFMLTFCLYLIVSLIFFIIYKVKRLLHHTLCSIRGSMEVVDLV